MKKYSLYQLQVYLQRVITLNFQEPVWVTAEISKSKASRGHIFLELVEKHAGDDEICAQGKAALWSRNIPGISSKLSVPLEDLLKEGTEVSIQIEVSYHTMHGLSLSVIDIDVEYTLGRMELHRQETIVRLKREGLLQLNSHIVLPDVIQRIAVISSSSASGYQDFIHHLDQNEYGYDFQVDLFPSAMQGTQLESEVRSALAQINQQDEYYDVIVLIRGGGSKLDLAGFDLYEVAKAISHSRLPVFTGIGHETDTTIADLVADVRAATPTAAAELAVPVLRDELLKLQQSQTRLYQVLQSKIDLAAKQVEHLQQSYVFRQPQRLYDAISEGSV